jgi:hypothetical protein
MVVLRSLVRLISTVGIAAAAAGAATTATAEPDPGAAIAQAVWSTAPPSATVSLSDLSVAYQTAVEGLQRLGMQPFFYPTAAAFCHDATTLGLVPALAGGVPGPWPRTMLPIPGVDPAAVKSGQTLFAFVPYGLKPDGADTSGMQVAWFNIGTGRGGFAAMGSLSQVAQSMVPPQVPPLLRPLAEQAVQAFFAAALPVGGVRAVPVDTGSGTVLAAVFGSVRNGVQTCYFLPTVGITQVP